MKKIIHIASLALLFTANAFAIEKPNIIFIMADDMGYASVPANNPKCSIPTPALVKSAVVWSWYRPLIKNDILKAVSLKQERIKGER